MDEIGTSGSSPLARINKLDGLVPSLLLFRSQRLHWLNAGRAACRNQSGNHGAGSEEKYRTAKDQWIVARDAVELAGQ